MSSLARCSRLLVNRKDGLPDPLDFSGFPNECYSALVGLAMTRGVSVLDKRTIRRAGKKALQDSRIRLKKFWRQVKILARETFNGCIDDDTPQLAAALSFYSIFSAAPILLVLAGVVGRVLGDEAARGEIVQQLYGIVGREVAVVLERIVLNASERAAALTFTGIITFLFGATAVFAELHSALNRIWNVKAVSTNIVKTFLRKRLLAIGMIALLGPLLFVSIMLSAALAGLQNRLGLPLPLAVPFSRLVEIGLTLVFSTIAIFLVFKLVPDVIIDWRDALVGAGVTAVLFTVGKSIASWYLGHSTFASVYGAAGSLVVLLLWTYYSAQIIFVGAEFTWAWARHHGRRILPAENAVQVVLVERRRD